MTIARLDEHPRYNNTRIISKDLIRLGNAVKRDISRIIALHNTESTIKTPELIRACKQRILNRLEKISKIRKEFKNIAKGYSENSSEEERWKKILQDTLNQIYKHKKTEETQQLFRALYYIDVTDTTETGAHFIEAYMHIVARVPAERVYLPFK